MPASDAEYSIVDHSLLIDGHWVEYLPGTTPGPTSERSGESSWTWQANGVDAFEPGLHTLQVSGRDRAGFAPTATIQYGMDPDPPQTPALSVPSTAVVGPIGLTWPALHDTLSGIAAVEVTVDGRVVLRPAISARAATVTLGAGRHTLQLTVTDRAGNRASSARSVSVLTPTPPRAARITSPAAGSQLGRSARVSWAAAVPGPGARVTGYRVRIDRRPSITIAADRRTTLFRLAPGTHVATVVALDSRGLTSAPATVRFRVR